MKKKVHLISVIIPAYKQEKTIKNDLIRIKHVLDQLRYDYEIILVVDGNADKTLQNAQKMKFNKIIVTGYNTNKGKGHAVRFGMAKAKGDKMNLLFHRENTR